MQLRRQYLYFCTSKESKLEPRVHVTHDISVLKGRHAAQASVFVLLC
jgi:hypothetical protein